MPDDDRFPQYLSPSWKKVLRCLQRRRPADNAADAVASAIAATIRDVRGVPGLPAIVARMQEDAAAGAAVQSRLPGSAQTRSHVPTDVAERAAAGFAATMQSELALVSPTHAAMLLARRVVEGLAYHYGLDRIAPLLAAGGVYSTRELRDLFSEILASDQISKLAKSLLMKPTGKGLRAPARRRARRPLNELINTPIGRVAELSRRRSW